MFTLLENLIVVTRIESYHGTSLNLWKSPCYFERSCVSKCTDIQTTFQRVSLSLAGNDIDVFMTDSHKDEFAQFLDESTSVYIQFEDLC